ncbi:MAG TPA: hypothetical protein VI612_00550 [Candidatus Nanoarchaeia archaeon]|nr:hypothetical protein [Candidatus Nanoarchaeia archaeon]
MPQPNHLLSRNKLLRSVKERVMYFQRTSPDALVLTPEERILVELRDAEHEGSWGVMVANLGTLVGKLPINSSLNSEADIMLIRKAMQPYEIQYGINLAGLPKPAEPFIPSH